MTALIIVFLIQKLVTGVDYSYNCLRSGISFSPSCIKPSLIGGKPPNVSIILVPFALFPEVHFSTEVSTKNIVGFVITEVLYGSFEKEAASQKTAKSARYK